MEERKGRITFSRAGGTASAESKTAKLSIPVSWLREMGLDSENRRVVLGFDGEKIVIRPEETLETFCRKRLRLGHRVMSLLYYDRDQLCTRICADWTDRALRYENETDDPVKTAFGKTETPSWQDFLSFLEERCIPRQRGGLREYLETFGLNEYDPVAIIEKTGGRMAEDHQHIALEVLNNEH